MNMVLNHDERFSFRCIQKLSTIMRVNEEWRKCARELLMLRPFYIIHCVLRGLEFYSLYCELPSWLQLSSLHLSATDKMRPARGQSPEPLMFHVGNLTTK
jgi:hypothetical protein